MIVRPLCVQPREQPHDPGPGRRVEAAGRLVGEQDRRLRDQRPGDRRRAAARRRTAGSVDGSPGQRGPRPSARPAPSAGGRDPRGRRAGSATLSTAAVRASRFHCWKMKPTNRLRIFASASSPSRDTSTPASTYWPWSAHVEATEDVHEGALARAGGPDDRDELAPIDPEVHAAQGVDGRRSGGPERPLGGPVALDDPLHRDEWLADGHADCGAGVGARPVARSTAFGSTPNASSATEATRGEAATEVPTPVLGGRRAQRLHDGRCPRSGRTRSASASRS